uniref:Uncharacterized protein n=1 Tax=Glossina pallidipes TaxID=7398 RepID=A0A1A9ZC46_GLOPL
MLQFYSFNIRHSSLNVLNLPTNPWSFWCEWSRLQARSPNTLPLYCRQRRKVTETASNGNSLLNNGDDFLPLFTNSLRVFTNHILRTFVTSSFELELYKVGIFDHRKIFEPAAIACISDQLFMYHEGITSQNT